MQSTIKKQKTIRQLTYNDVKTEKDYTLNRWSVADDSVFEELGKHVKNDDDKEKISSFLNLYYYFIISYSKTCFKKNADWIHNTEKNYNSNKTTRYTKLFDYNLANQHESHSKLLDIQSELYKYRRQYKKALKDNVNYWKNEKIKEIMDFIDDKMILLTSDISDPVLCKSDNINSTIAKYAVKKTGVVAPGKSKKINYEAFAAYLAANPDMNTIKI